MRVLIAHNRYRLEGGEERDVDLLTSGLGAADVAVRRYEQNSKALERSAIRSGLTAATLAYRPGGGGIGAALRAWQPSVVHFHNIWPLLTPSALHLARRSGAKVVLTAHNYRFVCPAGTLLRNGVRHQDCIDGSSLWCGLHNPRGSWAESLAYGVALSIQRRLGMLRRWVDAFVAPSEFMAEILVRSGLSRERVHVIPYGIPIPERHSAPGREHVLFAGRLVAEKGVHTLLEASQRMPGVPVMVAGDGPLADLVKASGGPSIRYVGRLDRDGLAAALERAAFTVIPSEWYDNLPFSALESLGAGRPVVASRLGGLSEIITDGENGRLVAPGDPPGLAAAIEDLWRSPDRVARMGAGARRTAECRYELGHHIGEITDLYGRLTHART